jgi:GNAT superfamily N-acetyltransferase
MTEADRPGMRDSTRASIQDLQVRLGAQPKPAGQRTQASTSGAALIDQLLQIDAGGACVAVLDGQVCAAMAGLREGLWYLAHLHVRPGLQGRGVGRRLLEAALRYGPQARGRLLHSSLDPQAMRCYHRAGFTLEPALQATGSLATSARPPAAASPAPTTPSSDDTVGQPLILEVSGLTSANRQRTAFGMSESQRPRVTVTRAL